MTILQIDNLTKHTVILWMPFLTIIYWPPVMDITWYRVRTGPLRFNPLPLHLRSHITPSRDWNNFCHLMLKKKPFLTTKCEAKTHRHHIESFMIWGAISINSGETSHLLERVGCNAWRKSSENMTCLSWGAVGKNFVEVFGQEGLLSHGHVQLLKGVRRASIIRWQKHDLR